MLTNYSCFGSCFDSDPTSIKWTHRVVQVAIQSFERVLCGCIFDLVSIARVTESNVAGSIIHAIGLGTIILEFVSGPGVASHTPRRLCITHGEQINHSSV